MLHEILFEARRNGGRFDELRSSDLELTAGGRRLAISTLSDGEAPWSIALLLDRSASTSPPEFESIARRSAAVLSGSARMGDELRLIVFSDRREADQTWVVSNAHPPELVALPPLSGGTAIVDTLAVAMAWSWDSPRRRAVVLVSDGWDGHGLLTPEDLSAIAAERAVPVFWIRPSEPSGPGRRPRSASQRREDSLAPPLGLTPAPPTAWRSQEALRHHRMGIERFVSRTGGGVVEVSSFQHVDQAMTSIIDRLRATYVLTYYAPAGDPRGGNEKVKLRATLADVSLRLLYPPPH